MIRFILAVKDFLLRRTDPILALFLFLVTNYRFSFKILAIVAIYIYRPNFKFRRNGIFWFYSGIIALSLFNLLAVSNDLSAAHSTVVLAACLIWLACLLTFHQIDLFVTENPVSKIVNTLKLLVIINLLFSIFDLAGVMLATHTINPYTQIAPPPYGISSGDLIGGVFGEMHLVNMSISAFLLVFFLYRKEVLFALLNTIPFLLTGSNLGTLIVVTLLLCIFVFRNSLIIRYQVLFSLAVVAVFYIKVTPDNLSYFQKTFSKQLHSGEPISSSEGKPAPASHQPKEEEIKRKKIAQYLSYTRRDKALPKTDSVYYLKMEKLKEEDVWKQKRDDYTHYIKDSIQAAKNRDRKFAFGKLKKFNFDARSGKRISFDQVSGYMQSDPKHLLFGSGPAGFSSRLAFIVSGIIGDSRILMALPYYENPVFTQNHKAIFHYLQYLDDEYHSITNLPFSWYAELLGEYGLTGTLLFVISYLGFFIYKFRWLRVGRVLLVMILAFFLFDYWFQRLSVMVLFELILLLDVKINSEKEQLHEQE